MRLTRRDSALVFAVLTFGAVSAPPARDAAGPEAPLQPARGRFIVAFELKADVRQEFVWPLETFPPARQTEVLLVVEEMPRVRAAGRAAAEPLSASRHLRINGRLQNPQRPARRPSGFFPSNEFVVALRDGRLRLSLTLPVGSEPDERHRTARVALYEIESPTPERD